LIDFGNSLYCQKTTGHYISHLSRPRRNGASDMVCESFVSALLFAVRWANLLDDFDGKKDNFFHV
jgi:hypothetical protein